MVFMASSKRFVKIYYILEFKCSFIPILVLMQSYNLVTLEFQLIS